MIEAQVHLIEAQVDFLILYFTLLIGTKGELHWRGLLDSSAVSPRLFAVTHVLVQHCGGTGSADAPYITLRRRT